MKPAKQPPRSVDEYIARYPAPVRSILEQIRAVIRKAAPDAEELISYQMPVYKLHGKLVHFAAFKNHVGFYPRVSGIERFKTELAGYEAEKGTVRFPLDQSVPYDLIGRIVEFRVRENMQDAGT